MTQQVRLTCMAALATVLSSLCLGAVFDGWAWLPPTVFVVAVTAAGCEGGRRLGCPRPLVPLVGALAAVVALTFAFAADQAWLWLVPNAEVVRHGADLIASARHDIAVYAAPVAASRGLILLAAAGAAGIAVVVDTLAVTYRRPAVAGLALLGLYTVPASVAPDGTGWGAFALGAAGYLALLVTEARDKVSRWGRALDRSGRRDGSAPLAAVGRRVGVAAIGAAVLLPVLLPAMDDGLISGNGPGRGHGGGGAVKVGNPIVDLGRDLNRPDPITYLTYQTDAAVPSYLRLVSLDDFTGRQWEPTQLKVPPTQRVTNGLGSPTGLGGSVKTVDGIKTFITVQNLDSKWLPLPYPTTRVEDIKGAWLWDQATFNVYPGDADESTLDKSYVAVSRQVQPTPEQLRNAGDPVADFSRFLKLPSRMPPIILARAKQVTAGKTTSYDKAVALQDWLRSDEFTYSTKAPDGDGLENIKNFLTDKRGFCVHFASAMAVMARALDIPARVAVGFTPGTADERGTHTITSNDAHAWPELYFDGVGWLAFEPTPSVRTGQAPVYTRPAVATPGSTSPTPTASSSATPGGAGNTGVRPDVAESQGQGANKGGSAVRQLNWTAVLTVLVVLAILASPAATRVLLRRRRWRGATGPRQLADAAWSETRDLAVDYGIDVPESRTPRQFAALLDTEARLDERAGTALARLAGAAERSQYAREVGDVGDLRDAVHRVAAALAANASRRRRLRARWLPTSVLEVRHTAGERVADGLDWMDRGAANLRSRLVPRRRPAR